MNNLENYNYFTVIITLSYFVYQFMLNYFNYVVNILDYKEDIKPLEFSKNLLNFNSYDNETLDDDIINIDNSDIKEDSNIYDVFISTNYETEMKNLNNIFYKNLNIEFDILIENNGINIEDFIEDYSGFQYNILDSNNEFYKIQIKSNNIKRTFNTIFNILSDYYNKSTTNIIFNYKDFDNLEKYFLDNNVSHVFVHDIPVYKFLNFNLISIYDVYGHLNNDKKILDYNNINFKTIEELRNYFNSKDTYTNKSFLSQFF